MFENEGQGAEVVQENLEGQGTEGGGAPAGEKPPEVIDLDTVEKFKYGGRELTPKELQGMVMFQSDYTRKTQALAEERKYYDNLHADLRNVRNDPTLAEKFKEVYPEKFHSFLEHLQSPASQAGAQAQQATQAKPALDPELKQKLDRIDEVYGDLKERRVAAAEAMIDSKFKVLAPKYPMADEESVIARAQAFIDERRKENPRYQVTDKDWESLWKSDHERHSKRMEAYYAAQVQKQKLANSKGRDVGSGGGTPGQAPKNPRTIKEATAYALQELENS